MSTLTSLVKSSKRKIIRTKAEEPIERERDSTRASQKVPGSTRRSASKRSFLGNPDQETSRSFLGNPDQETSRSFLGNPDQETSRSFLGNPDQETSRSFLGSPDTSASQDATSPQ